MTYPRQQFGALSLEVPPGLFVDDEAPCGYVVALSAVVPATLRVRMTTLSGASDLSAMIAGLQGAQPREVEAISEAYVWPGLAADIPGEPQQTHYFFESDGQVWHGIVEAPCDLWADYAPFLEGAMLSLDLGEQPAPTVSLFGASSLPIISEKAPLQDTGAEMRRRLAEVSDQALALILAGRSSEAEAIVRELDGDASGANVLADVYEAALEQNSSEPGLLERAIFWVRSSFPEPHTAIEAEEYRSAASQRENHLRDTYGFR